MEFLRSITFISPSLNAGGAERVITELANHAAAHNLKVNLVLLTKQPHHYEIDQHIELYEPAFDINRLNKLVYQWKSYWWLRRTLTLIGPSNILSFGGKYNSFVLLAAVGINKRVFISDRSKPTISYGYMLDILNPIIYRLAYGIICQTSMSKEVQFKRTNHSNIKIIANPVRTIVDQVLEKENYILNVGRFIGTKHQDWLVEYFSAIRTGEWKLDFIGEGPRLEKVKAMKMVQDKYDKITFYKNIRSIEHYYNRSTIFAFTSSSEGFPNALAEAMQAGCACLSFDCEAGPSDLIEDGVNGFLIPVGDHALYKEKLQLLIDNPLLSRKIGMAAHNSMKALSVEKIGAKYLDFIINS